MQSRFPSINTQAVTYTIRVYSQITVNCVQLFDMHVIVEPLIPHGMFCMGLHECYVPQRRQRVGDEGTKMRCNRRLVLMKPILYSQRNTDTITYKHMYAYNSFSERELTFTFAICYRPSYCLSSVVCPLSVCLSVTLLHPTQAIEIFGNVSTPFNTMAIC